MLNPWQAPSAGAGAARPTVAIVGSGASGLLTALHLLRTASRRRSPLRLVLIERNDHSGGVAYSTDDPGHRLNVTAARMSALDDAPDDFVTWRAANVGSFDRGAYAPRGEYQRYLEELVGSAVRDAAPGVALVRVRAGVDAVEPSAAGLRLHFDRGGGLEADAAVLALGNLAPLPPAGCEDVAEHGLYMNDPWAPGALERLAPPAGATVLLIGTGLTMVDVATSLARRWPTARLVAASRGGLLPRAHVSGRSMPRPLGAAIDPRASLTELVDEVLARSAAGEPDWHQHVDSLRPRTQALWRRMSTAERAEFLATRHRAWCVRRHRMPPEVAAALADLIGSGRLEVRSGSVELAADAPDSIRALVNGTGAGEVALAINCTGPGLDPRASRDPLVRQLLRAGHVCAHRLGIGFDTTSSGAFRARRGAGSRRLFTLGPPRIGELYETTAIPEIRGQAEALAQLLVTMLDADTASAARPSTRRAATAVRA